MSRLMIALLVAALAIGSVGTVASAAPGPGDELDAVYASPWTGQVYGVQPGPYIEVSEADGPVVLCASRYTSAFRWSASQVCTGYELPVLVDWSGSVDACFSRYTGALRYPGAGSCTAYEYAVTL